MVTDGFTTLRVSEKTHAYLKEQARERSMSMHELIIISVKAYTGKDISGSKGIAEYPLATVNLEKIAANTAATLAMLESIFHFLPSSEHPANDGDNGDVKSPDKAKPDSHHQEPLKDL